MNFPIVQFFEEAEALLDTKRVRIPTLFSTALILATQRSDHIYVPPLELREKIESAIDQLPPSIRGRISLVDTNQRLLKRIYNYVEPLKDQIDRNNADTPEASFVHETIPFLYQLALGSKYKAATTGSGIESLIHYLHIIRFAKFTGEAKARLATLSNLIISYKPFLSTHANAEGYLGDPGIRKKFFSMLDTAEFQEVVDKSGKLGLARHPRVALNKLRQSVSALLRRPEIEGVAKATDAVMSLVGHPTPSGALAEIEKVFENSNKFSPPALDLNPFRADIYTATLAEYSSECTPPPGALYEIQPHEPEVCGCMWATTRKEMTDTQMNIHKHPENRVGCYDTAKRAVSRFLAN